MLNNIITRLASFDDTLSTKDIAILLECHPETVRRLIYADKLQCIRYEGGYIIAKKWLLEYLSKYTPKSSYQERLQKTKEDVIGFCSEPRTYAEILSFTGYCNKSHLQRMITRPLIKEGRLRLTIPGSPHHNGQKYISL